MAELSEEALLSVLPTIRVPKAGDRVHKDECAFSFDTPGMGGCLPVCEETMLLPLPLGPRSSASLVLPAPGVEGAYLCVSVCVCACASLCAASSTEGSVSAPPSPLCLLPVWSGQEGYEGNGDPLALLPQSFLYPVSSLSSGKCQNT
uniref:Ubiquitin specific peptidase 5 n=1 Tax=Pipistrellus kuhlii TaxID=59472 RepID=A0A7J7ZNS8_PIPKU|nr:ubiquitin specific peptidase 5 [Pipistrellus kuhlii]